MKQLRFRTRLFLILSLFALAPALAVTIAWAVFVSQAAPIVAGTAAWERLATTGSEALGAVDSLAMTDAQRQALRAHERELEQSVTQSRRLGFVARRAAPAIVIGALALVLVLGVVASRVAGHLSRQLSRPLNELVGWAHLIERGDALPREGSQRGAPEFRELRERMRSMSVALAEGRARVVEAERLHAFREAARRVAHELKNPLTPIRFAVARLKRDASPDLADAIEVLDVETSRIQGLSRANAQFGRLPEGTPSDVDFGELVRYAAMSSIPTHLQAEVFVEDDLPMVRGHYDALQRAVTNILLNAVDACGQSGRVTVGATRTSVQGTVGVEVSVQDTGCGIPADRLARIWDPYVTSKPAGTGLGLAIVHQTILAHHGYVSARSEPQTGTVIRFAVPASGVESSKAEG